ncbi:MAG: CHAT domain-containing tetratricopeptide repeat protein, partial [Cyanobacteria bacterium J06555_13]
LPAFSGSAHSEKADREPLSQEEETAPYPNRLAQNIEEIEQAAQLFQAGLSYYNASQMTAAVASWQQALAIYQRLGERGTAAEILANLGLAYSALSDYTAAVDLGQQGLDLARALGDRTTASNALGNLGSTFRNLGDYANAIAYQEEALSIKQSLGERQAEGYILGNLGNAYKLLGLYEQALDYQNQSLAIARELGDRTQESLVLGNLGAIYADQENYVDAIDAYERSLSVSQTINNLRLESYSLANLGNAHHAFTRRCDTAEAYYLQSLNIAETTGDKWLAAKSLGSLGLIYEEFKDYPQAIEFYDRALVLFQSIGEREWTAKTLNNRAHTLLVWHENTQEADPATLLTDKLLTDKLQAAAQNLTDATQLLDQLRQTLTTDASRVSLFDTQVMTYNLLQQVLIAQDKPEAALEASEAGRSRAFTSLLLSQQAGQSEPANTEPLTVADIQHFAQQQNATLVEYAIMPNDDVIHQGKIHGKAEELFIWVISPAGKVDFRRVRLDEYEINLAATVADSLSSIEKRSRGFRPAAVATENTQVEHLTALHEILIEPVADLLPTQATDAVIFVAQGELFSVPFPALIDPQGDYLIENHTILTAPSIRVLQLAERAQASKPHRPMAAFNRDNFLIVGNPDMPSVWDATSRQTIPLAELPGAEIEATTVGALFGHAPLLNKSATEQAVRQRLSTARVVHLATHGLLEYGNPEDSGVSDVPGAIALTPDDKHDGLLTAAEIST